MWPSRSCFSMSLIYKTPMILSILSSYTGMREKPPCKARSTASSTVASLSKVTISIRGIITSRTVVSANSKILWIISVSSSSSTPCSSPTVSNKRSSSSVTKGPGRLTCPPMRRTRVLVIALSAHTTGCRSHETARTGFTKARAQRSGFCTATVLGAISQKIRTTNEVRTVAISSPKVREKRRASTVAILAATITATLFTIRIVKRNLFGLESVFSI